MADINQKVLDYANKQSGRYGNGECWTLAEDAVVKSGGKSSKGMTKNFGPNSDYIWGDSVVLGAIKPGDILQFRNYSWKRTTDLKVTQPDGAWETKKNIASQGRSHHTAIVVAKLNSGMVEVIEQNIPAGSGPVQTVALLFSAGAPTTKRDAEKTDDGDVVTLTTITDTVSNPPKAFRPKT